MKCNKCSFENPDRSIFCGRCGSRFEAPDKDRTVTQIFTSPLSNLKIGSELDKRYQIIEELGRGGMGRVYKAVDIEIDEKIAIKVLNPEISRDANTIERFRNELKVARRIRHKNVCQMFDLEKSDGMYFITMEYVSGEDLKNTINRLGQLSEGKSLIIAKQICKGLAEAHHLGIVHRDLKPQNIMIDRAGDVRLMDFGIARSQMSAGLTETGAMIGTPEYMSPEQAVGEDVDHRSDIYSLGIILFELVTGKTPFKGETAVSVALKHKTEKPPDPRKLNEHVSYKLGDVILKCLEKDRNKRYESIQDILAELVSIEEGMSTTDKVMPDKPESIETKPKKRFPSYALPGFVALLLLGIVGIWLLLPKGGSGPAVPSEVTLSIASEPAGAGVYLGDEMLGQTPLEEKVESGTYSLKLFKEGYHPIEENIELKKDLDRTFSLVPTEELSADLASEDPEASDPDAPDTEEGDPEATVDPADQDTEIPVIADVGTLEITSIPDGAEVFIDEEKKGTTPLNLELAVGTHALSLVHPNYEQKQENIRIETGQTLAKEYLLDQKTGYALEVTSEPSGARVYIDGTYRGTTPVRNLELTASTGTMRVRKDGYGYKDVRLDLTSGPNRQHVTLEQQTFRLTLNSEPAGALVYLGGRELGATPVTRTLSAGTYKIRIAKEGYQSQEVTIHLDKDLEQSYTLASAVQVSLQIKVRPKANVFMDGQLLREVPPTLNLKVLAGQHTFDFISEDSEKKYTTTVDIQPGANWELRMFMDDGRFIRINQDTGEQTEKQLKISDSLF